MNRFGQEASIPTPAADPSGFTAVSSGIASILAPLAQVGVSIYQTKELQKLEKARMKAEAASAAAMPMMMPQAPMVVQSNTGLLIGVVAGGALMLGLLIFLLTRKKGPETEVSTSSGVSATTTSSAPRIKRIKRISRPRNQY